MKVGVQLPLHVGGGEGKHLYAFVAQMDELSFDSIWLGDHIVVPATIDLSNGYPYGLRSMPDQTELFPTKSFIEAVATAGFLAGASQRLQIGVGVFIVAMRNPVVLAKQLATLDVLSGGRLIAGVGAGWIREEFEALGAAFDNREDRLDEAIDVMRRLWSDDQPAGYQGEFTSFAPLYALPTPTQAGGPPLWFDGHTAAALRRCARLGSGWHAIGLSPLDFKHGNAELDTDLATIGRDPRAVTRSVACRLPLSDDRSREQAQQLIASYADAGCDHLIVYSSPRSSLAQNLERYRRLAELL